VWTPTEASWINLIEAQFGLQKRFTMVHTDDLTHAGLIFGAARAKLN